MPEQVVPLVQTRAKPEATVSPNSHLEGLTTEMQHLHYPDLCPKESAIAVGLDLQPHSLAQMSPEKDGFCRRTALFYQSSAAEIIDRRHGRGRPIVVLSRNESRAACMASERPGVHGSSPLDLSILPAWGFHSIVAIPGSADSESSLDLAEEIAPHKCLPAKGCPHVKAGVLNKC